MSWATIANQLIPAGSYVRVALGFNAAPGFAPGSVELTTAIHNNAAVNVGAIYEDALAMHIPFLGVSVWVEVTTSADMSDADLRAQFYDAMADLEANRAVSGISNVQVGDVQLEAADSPTVPVTTTVTLVAVAILGLVAVYFIRR